MGRKAREEMAAAAARLAERKAELHGPVGSPGNRGVCACGCGEPATHKLHVPGRPDRLIAEPIRCGATLCPGPEFSYASVSRLPVVA